MSVEKWEAVLNQIDAGVVVADLEDRLVLVNQAARAAFGVGEALVEGRRLSEVIAHPDVRALLASGRRQGEILLADGRVFNVRLTLIGGVGRALVMQDITHLKELDRLKSEFVATVSHDLRSPLTAILGYADLLGRVGPLNEQQTEFTRRIQYGVQSITHLLTDLLELGRIEAGFDAQKAPTQLAPVAHYAVDGLRARAEAKRQTLLVDVPDDLPEVFASPPRLRQMLSNLIDNAIHYTPEGGIVSVTARDEGDLVILAVSDSGIGIPPSDQPYVFDKFYRASNTRQESTGTGLGLAIVKSIVESHGGRIWLESRPGEGTTFTVMLPQHRERGGKGATAPL